MVLASQPSTSHLSQRWTCLNKMTLYLSCYCQEYIQQHLWLPFIKVHYSSEASLYSSFTWPFCNCVRRIRNPRERPASSMHTLTQACHNNGMWGMHPAHQRMICIHSVGWASHSGAHPQGLHICKTATHPLLANLASTALSVLPNRVKGRNTSGRCWWGQSAACSPEIKRGCRSPHYSLMWNAQISCSS